MPSSRDFDLCSLVISDDNLYASVVAEIGTVLSVSDVKRALVKAGIVGAYEDDQIEAMLDMAAPGDPVLVAAGTPPVLGVDARVEYFFQTESRVVATEGSDDKLDWKAIRDRSFVKAGAVLARKHAPTKGVDGRDLFGQRIIARHGEDCSLLVGENVAFGTDGRSLVARKAGVAKRNENGSVSVADVITVKDVDLASGSLCTLGAVLVDGNVTEGFTVEAAGDVYVRGNVEAATIVAGGRVIVGGGVRHQGKVEAVGAVAVRFVDPESTVHTLGDLDVVGSAIGAQLSALGPVVVGDEIAGGRVESATSIQCQRAGSEADVRTLFVVGSGPTAETIALAKNEVAALERRLGRAPSLEDHEEEGVPSLRAPLVPKDTGTRSPSQPPPRPSLATGISRAPGRSEPPPRGSLPARPLAPSLGPRPSLPQRPGPIATSSAPRPGSLPARPSTSLPVRPSGSLPARPLVPSASSMRVAATSARPSQQMLARPSVASMRAAPSARATEQAVTSAKREFQLEHQLLATKRQIAFHTERHERGSPHVPFVLVEGEAHAGVVVRIDREETALEGARTGRRFVLLEGELRVLGADEPFTAEEAAPEPQT
jgi:hypothetical protein